MAPYPKSQHSMSDHHQKIIEGTPVTMRKSTSINLLGFPTENDAQKWARERWERRVGALTLLAKLMCISNYFEKNEKKYIYIYIERNICTYSNHISYVYSNVHILHILQLFIYNSQKDCFKKRRQTTTYQPRWFEFPLVALLQKNRFPQHRVASSYLPSARILHWMSRPTREISPASGNW